MEHLHFRLAGGAPIAAARACIVGVVASGNLEVLIEPVALDGACTVDVDTAAQGFAPVWEAVMDDFQARHRIGDARIAINDNGATPATVSLRLDQAVEEYRASAGGAL